MTKAKFNIAFDVFVVLAVAYSMMVSYRNGSELTFGRWHDLVYFTYQSNIWIALVALLELMSASFRRQDCRWTRVVKLVFTSSIALTGIVYCFILSPIDGFRLELDCVFLHVAVPIAAVVGWIVSSGHFRIAWRLVWWNLLPPLYYFAFATYGYLRNWQFSEGCNYPYFFMNWGKALWWVPMWFVVVGGLLCAIAAVLIWMNNKRS